MLLNKPAQIGQAVNNPRHLRFCAPMLFGGEVDNPARAHQLAGLGNKHAAGLHLASLAGFGVGLHVSGKALLEHQGNALAHDTNGIHRVHQCLDICFQQVALCIGDHGCLLKSTSPEYSGYPVPHPARPLARVILPAPPRYSKQLQAGPGSAHGDESGPRPGSARPFPGRPGYVGSRVAAAVASQ